MEGKIIIVGATGYTGSALAKLLKQENEKYSDKQLKEFIEWLEVLAEIEVELILKSKQ